MFESLPDGFLADDLIFFDGPRHGAHVAKGFNIELQALDKASMAARNKFQDQIRGLLKFLPERYWMQICWTADSDYRSALINHAAETGDCKNEVTKRTRNLLVLRHLQEMQNGHLRRERVSIFIGRRLDSTPESGWLRFKKERFYADHLEQLKSEFANIEKELSVLFYAMGARAKGMTDDDHYRLFSRKLNPSHADRSDYDPLSTYDPEASLLDNCWHGELRGQGVRGFYMDEYFFGVLLLKRWPSESYPTQIYGLTQLPFGEYDITSNVRRLNAQAVIVAEQRALDRINQQLTRKSDQRLVVAAANKEERIRRLSEGSILPLSVEFIIVARAKTPEALSRKMLALKSAINSLNGAQYYEATLPASARNYFIKTWPGWMWSGHDGLRLYGEDTFVADLLPLSSTFVGRLEKPDAILSGANRNLVGLSFGNEVAGALRNWIILGMAGSGKSALVQHLLITSQPKIEFCVIIEEGFSHAAYTRSFGIEPIQFRLGGNHTINIFDTRGLPMTPFQKSSITAAISMMLCLAGDESQRLRATVAKYVARLCHEYAEDKLRLRTDQERFELAREALAFHEWARQRNLDAAEAFADFRAWQQNEPDKSAAFITQFDALAVSEFESRQGHIVRDFLFCSLSRSEHLTLSSLREYLEMNAEGPESEDCRLLATLLMPWCRGGNYGDMWDGPATVSLDGPVVHFELGSVPESAKELKTLIGFILINDVRQHLLSMPRSARKQMVIEEVSRFVEVPNGEKILSEVFQQLRKYNVQVFALLQQYSQIADSPIRTALMGNARAFAIFNPGDRRDLERLAADIGLSSVAVETILRYARPDQLTGQKYSEFCYFEPDPQEPICGTVRYIRPPGDG